MGSNTEPEARRSFAEGVGGLSGDDLPDGSRDTAHYVRDYLATLAALLAAVDTDAVVRATDLLEAAYQNGGRLVLCGNGGSGATASHLACDFLKAIRLEVPGNRPFEVIALSDSPALLSAWGNDAGFAEVFAGPARTWLREGDVLLALSASGNSPNVLRAVAVARQIGATSIGLCGYGGGALAAAVDLPLVTSRRNMQQVEDLHLAIGHLLFSALRDRIQGRIDHQ
ncbi:MAG: SIS domain-containing protein [Cytophagales bacterium]|nr:SIS domain-containing protein [Armatimonadota bacterium]